MKQDEFVVPFAQFRVGAVIEFNYGVSRVQGTIQALYVNGARNFLAVLSRKVDQHGVVKEGIDPVTGCSMAINLAHATRVISHSNGPVVFEQDNYSTNRRAEELAELNTNGVMARRGKRLLIDGEKCYAPGAVRDLVVQYIFVNRAALSILPWEVVDLQRLIEALRQQGILKEVTRPEFDYIPVAATLHMSRLKRFVRQNVNRFKLDTRREAKLRREAEEKMYREDMEREMARYREEACDDLELETASTD